MRFVFLQARKRFSRRVKFTRFCPDEKAERSDYIRVIDDEGEDYLYPKNYFVFAPLPQDVEKALLQAI